MIFLPELYYLQDQQDFPFRKAVTITARTVGRWCNHYRAELIVPISETTQPRTCHGILPARGAEKEIFIEGLVAWLFAHSAVESLFALFLDAEALPVEGEVAKFDHHDDTCCWALNLTEREFGELRQAWVANDLPEDLFYPEGQGVCVPYPGRGVLARGIRSLGGQRCYTPRQWQMRHQS